MWSILTKDKTYLKSEFLTTKIRMAEICRVLVVTLLLCLFWLPSDDAEENESFGGTFSVKDYTSWLKKHKIQLFNYAVEVNETVVIWSPILPVPKGLHWSSLNMENELSALTNQKHGLAYSHYFDKFLKTYNKSWARVFAFDRLNRNLRIQQVNLGYADMYRLHVDENKKDSGRKQMSSKDQDFDLAITLMTYTSHECEVKGGPQSPKQGDMLVMSCSVVVNGLWNTSLVFRNTFDRSEIRGEVSKCNRQPSVGSRICSTVRVKAEADILAYTCDLEFLPDRREDPKNPMFQNSKWTTRFNKEVVCYLPKIYLKEVSDNISSVAHGYPQPVKDLQITKDNSAPMILEEESEALKRMVEHVEKIEKHINDGGIVKHALNNNVHSLLNGTINASIQLLKMGRGEDRALGEGEEVDTNLETTYQQLSEMIDIVCKHVHDVDRKLAAIAAPKNGEPLSEIVMQDLKEELTKLEREIRTVDKKVREKLNSILTEVTVPEENSLTNDEESEEDHEQLIDEVNELTVLFMDAYNLNMGEEKVKELYDSIIQNYEFPGLEYKGDVFMDSEELSDSVDEASAVETASPVATEDLTGDIQSMPETDSLSTTEAIPARTAESLAGSREAGNDTESDSAEEKGDAVIPDNTTVAVSDGEATQKPVSSTINSTQADKYQKMSPVMADKEPDEPDKEPVESSTEPAESVKEPDESDRKPVEYTREVTEESQFSQMRETEMEHSEVKDEYENNGTQETFESKEDTQGGSLIMDSGSVDEDVTTKPKEAAEAEAGAAAGDFGADGNFADLNDGNKISSRDQRACRDAMDKYRELQQFSSTRCKGGSSGIDGGGGSSGIEEGGGSGGNRKVGGSSGIDGGGGSSGIEEGGGSGGNRKGGGNGGRSKGVTDPNDGKMKNQMNQMTCADAYSEVRRLQIFVSTRCKGGVDKGGEDCPPCECDAGHHLQSVVLELFLLIFGACLTRIEV